MIKNPYLVPLIKSFKNIVHAIGFDVVQYDLYHSEDKLLQSIIRQFNVKTVLDIGANIGQYGEELIRHGFKGNIYSFEPIPAIFQNLLKKSRHHSNWKVYNLGAGSKEEEAMINISENFVSSSILTVAKASLLAEPATKTTHQEKIRITKLDTFLEGKNFDKEILLKIDVQGYELEALKGVLKNLHEIKLIQAELSFTEIYEGGPLYEEVTEFLKAQGYEIFSINPGFRDERSGRMLQADGIFIRN